MDKNIKKNNLQIKGFFDKLTSTISYVVYDKFSKECAVIDSVLDFDYSSGSIDYLNAENIISFIEKNNLRLIWLIETHVHADHLSAAPYIQKKLGGKIGISEKISDVQNIFGKTFNAGTEFQRDGSQFDKLFKNNDEYQIRSLIHQGIHQHVQLILYQILFLLVILCLCQIWVVRELIFQVEMREHYISQLRKY